MYSVTVPLICSQPQLLQGTPCILRTSNSSEMQLFLLVASELQTPNSSLFHWVQFGSCNEALNVTPQRFDVVFVVMDMSVF